MSEQGSQDSNAEVEAGSLAEAQRHLEEGQVAEAIRLLEILVQREPDNALAHQELAVANVRAVRYGSAERAAQRALGLDPSLHLPHGVLARVALKKGRYLEAEAELEEQLEALPAEDVENRAAIHNLIGAIHFRQKRYEESEAALRRAMSLQPEKAVLRFNLAMLFLRTGQQDEAVAGLEHLLSLPDVPDGIAHPARFNLGHLYARRGRYGDAREQFTQALEIRTSFLGWLFRTMPFLARFRLTTLFAIVVMIALLVWLLLTRI